MGDMIGLKIDAERVTRSMEMLRVSCLDASPAMRAVQGDMERAVEKNFASQGRPAWVGLTPGTIAARIRRGTWPGKILQQSGQLAASIEGRSDSTSVTVGTNLVYAAIQQLGGKTRAHTITARKAKVLHFGGVFRRQVHHPGSKIPARPFLALDTDDEVQIARSVLLFLQGRLGE
jgi:phage virion morphogenesis protein